LTSVAAGAALDPVVEREKADPLDEYGQLPCAPVVSWGWGSIPDQYGRRSFDDEEEDYQE
jgi:hypothetical protein